MTSWECQACTFHNESGTNCSVCGTKRPSDFSVRIRSKQLIFTVPLKHTSTLAEFKDIVEQKCNVPKARQKLNQSLPTREISGPLHATMKSLLGIKDGDSVVHTVEVIELDPPEAKKPKAAPAPAKKPTPAAAAPAVAAGPPGGLAVPEDSDGFDSNEGGDDGFGDSAGASSSGAAGGDDFDEFDDGTEGWNDLKEDTKTEEEPDPSAGAPPLIRQQSYSIMDKDAVMQMQFELLDEIEDVLGVSVSEAGVVLRHYRYQKERLFQEWCANPAAVREKAGLSKAKDGRVETKVTGNFDCPLCADSVPGSETSALGCGHRYCNNCWQNWLHAEMESKGPQALFTNCITFQCHEIVPEDLFLRIVDGPRKRMYQSWVLKSFIEASPQLKWCPGAGCERAVYFPDPGQRDIDCACGHRWCFKCGQEAHQPCPCDYREKWLEKNKSDKDNADWMLANTKICPNCKVAIEKNQGCNHIKHEFCWLCKGDWKKHGSATGGYYTCNIYNERKAKGDVPDEEKGAQDAANKLQKFLFYFQRFQDHDKAARIAEKSIHETEARMEQMQNAKKSADIKVQFLLEAVRCVIECRRNLKWSYAFGYWLEDGSRQKSMFEGDQAQLEKFSDHLHELVEKDVTALMTEATRKEVQSYTAAANKFLHGLADAVLSGQYFSETKPTTDSKSPTKTESAKKETAKKPAAAAPKKGR